VLLPTPLRNRTPLTLVLGFLTLAGCAHAPQPTTAFPQFAGRKPNLEHVKLLCDVCVWQNMKGNVTQVLIDESSALGSEVERLTKGALVAKGYAVDGSACASIGSLHNTWTRSPSDTTAGLSRDPTGVFPAPFILDTKLLRSPAIVNAWTGLLTRLFWLDFRPPSTFYQPKPGEAPVFLTEAVTLCDSLGGGAIAVLTLDFGVLDESRGHNLEPFHANLVEKLTGGSLLGPSTTLVLTLVDGKTGEMLWHDSQSKHGSYDRKMIGQMIANIIEHLP
jgi:hypothetical protein